MGKKNRNYIDDMVDMFGYDYVIGYCLCSEYDVRNKIDKLDTENDEKEIEKLKRVANTYANKAEQLSRERVSNGL